MSLNQSRYYVQFRIYNVGKFMNIQLFFYKDEFGIK